MSEQAIVIDHSHWTVLFIVRSFTSIEPSSLSHGTPHPLAGGRRPRCRRPSPSLGRPPTHHANLHGDDELVAVPEDDSLLRKSTVVLVQRSQSPFPTAQPLVSHVPTQQKGQPEASFIPIPLTRRPEPPSRAPTEASMQSTYTRASQIPRLPTPDFGNPSEARRSNYQSNPQLLPLLLPAWPQLCLAAHPSIVVPVTVSH
jgi:hypothetical protein